MNVIAFDCSLNNLFLMLKCENFSRKISIDAKLRHSALLLSNIDKLLKEADISVKDLDLIVCGKGPGSFTGLRIALATAKGISFGTETPVVSISGLDAYAEKYFKAFYSKSVSKIVTPIIDGKKQRFYGAFFGEGKRLSEYFDKSVEDYKTLFEKDKDYVVVGADAKIFYDKLIEFDSSLSENVTVYEDSDDNNIEEILELGLKSQQYDNDASGPLYIRKSQAEEE